MAGDSQVFGQVTDSLSRLSVASRLPQHIGRPAAFADDSQHNFDESRFSGTVGAQ